MATISEALAIALQHHQAGRLPAAEHIYRQILAVEPEQPDAWHLLGVLAYQSGRHEVAIDYIGRAIALKDTEAAFHNNLGNVYKDQRKLDQAAACYRRALELQPRYAEACNNLGTAFRDQGKLDQAAACYRRALELKPDLAMAYSNLAVVLDNLGRTAEAAATAQQWLKVAPDNPTARHLLAAYTGQGTPARAADQYIRDTFDDFARTFDEQLQRLDYRAPQMVATATAAAFGAPQGALAILDAGCGTGWCGPLLRPYARHLTGVDLSPAMIDKARAQAVYDQLIEGELTAHLQESVERYDLVAASDTLIYFGDLQPVLTAAAGALRPRGFLIFNVERLPVEDPSARGFVLQHHGRYAHTETYVRSDLASAGLSVREVTFGVLRTELGQPVHGLLASACKDTLTRQTA